MIEAAQFPRRLTLELTNRCNFSCVMCPARMASPGLGENGDMRPELFRRLVDEAAEHLPVALVPFFRGESLLHPQLATLLAYAKARGLAPIQLATNASLLDEKMAHALLDSGLDFISFSLDSSQPPEYSSMRLGGDLGQVTTNVARFLEIRGQGGYSIEVQVSATRTAANQNGLEKFKDTWLDRVDRVRIYPQHSADGHYGSLPDHPAKDLRPRRACRKPFEEMVIYHQGKAALCNHDWQRTRPLGDAERLTLAGIWHGRAYQDVRANHLNPEQLTEEPCVNCDHWAMYYLDQGLIGELYQAASNGRGDQG